MDIFKQLIRNLISRINHTYSEGGIGSAEYKACLNYLSDMQDAQFSNVGAIGFLISEQQAAENSKRSLPIMPNNMVVDTDEGREYLHAMEQYYQNKAVLTLAPILIQGLVVEMGV